MRKNLDCNRCGHSWERRGRKNPIQCPACKSVRWNKPRVMETPPWRRARERGNDPEKARTTRDARSAMSPMKAPI